MSSCVPIKEHILCARKYISNSISREENNNKPEHTITGCHNTIKYNKIEWNHLISFFDSISFFA